MYRILILGLLLVCSAATARGQAVGDSVESIRSSLGAPQMSRTTSSGEQLWIYSDGVKIRFRNGVVSSIEGLEAGPDGVPVAPPSENMTVVPDLTPPARSAPESSTSSHASSSGSGGYNDYTRSGDEPPLWIMGLFFVGVAVLAICRIWLIVLGFRQSVWWGLGVWFVPIVPLVFVCTYWDDAKKPFLIQLGTIAAGLAVVFYHAFVRVGTA